jgi:hypothetical protein
LKFCSDLVFNQALLDSTLLLDETCDNKSDEEVSSSPLFRLGRSPVSVVDVTPIFVEDEIAPNDIPPVVGFDSDDDAANEELTGVVLVAALDSGRDDEVVSILLVAADDVLATVLGAGIEDVVEAAVAEDDAGVVDVVVFVELAGAAAVDTGGDWFVFGGDTT